MEEITREFVQSKIQKRSPYIHKGNCGRVLIVAGGAGMTGAAVLAARAALRSGSGLVYVCTPKSNFPVVQILAPEAICVDWSKVSSRFASLEEDWSYDAIAFGPGMGTGGATRRMLKEILLSYDGPLVLDADGLNTLAGDNDLAGFVQGFNGRVVLTPHVGEARRLLAALGDEETASREDMVRVLSEGYGAIAVMKGAQTLVAQPQEETGIWRNTTGNPGMATAGSGDVLTGVIASLAGQGLSLWDAARAGVWLHGAAGDLAADDKGEYGMIAGDIVDHLPYAIKRLF